MRQKVPPFKESFRANFRISLVMSCFGAIGFQGMFSDPPLLKAVLVVLAVVWSALAFSLTLATAQTWLFPILRFPSFLWTVLAISVSYLAVVLIGIPVGVAGTAALAVHGPNSATVAVRAVSYVLNPVVVLPAWIMMVVITMYFHLSKMMGPGVLKNWMLGRYYRPRQEERVFMFLDIKDSTMLAEKMGDMAFSRYVQQFFDDLSDPVIKTKGEVSHYIGDEAVLCWKVDQGLKNANVLRCFFLLKDVIQHHAQDYLKEFGVVPEFKAGAHLGSVVATQVGQIKSEIVFHGDVLNTTARTQGLCNELGSEFLVSSSLVEALGPTTEFRMMPMGRHSMKGKEDDVELFSVELV